MIYFYIYIGLVAITFIIACVKEKEDRKPQTIEIKNLGNTPIHTSTPIWMLLIISFIIAPISLFIFGYDYCNKLYYRNRPKPLSKKMRKYTKKDRVLDETGTTISIAKYNKQHETSFTLEQVYGKKYVSSITDEEKAQFDTAQDTLTIDDDLEDEYKDIAICYARARISNDFSEFEEYLTNETILTRLGKGRSVGSKDIIEYFNKLKTWREEDKSESSYYIEKCPYYEHVVVKEKISNGEPLLTLFIIKENKIQQLLLTPESAEWAIGYSPFNRPRYKKNIVSKLKGDSVDAEPFHLSCPECGKLSEDLKWKRVAIPTGIHGYVGNMSICPICGNEVEFFPDIRVRYEEPQFLELNKHTEFYPQLNEYTFMCDSVLEGTEYCNDLDPNFELENKYVPIGYKEEKPWKLRTLAEDFVTYMFSQLRENDPQQLENIKSCFVKAYNDGVKEAINNIAIIELNYQGKEKEGIEHWQEGVQLGVFTCANNMFVHLWGNEKYKEATEFLIKNHDLHICKYYLAVLYYLGEYEPGNILKKDSAKAKSILLELQESLNSNDEDEKDLLEKVDMFIENFTYISPIGKYGREIYDTLKKDAQKHEADGAFEYHNAEFLNDVEWDDKYTLFFSLPTDHEATGDTTKISLTNNENSITNIWEHLRVKKTIIGAWETYLLSSAETILPVWWHGGYIVRKFIFSMKDLDDIDEISGIDFDDKPEKILPNVKIENNVATIECTYWNDWQGLVRETTKYQYNGNLITEVDSYSEVLFAYNCQILF